jgi:hypothetical protein
MNPSKKAWISLDSFGRFGAFQWVTANPKKKILPRLNSRLGLCPERIELIPTVVFPFIPLLAATRLATGGHFPITQTR